MTRTRLRELVGGLIVAVMAVSAAYGGGFFGLRERFPPPASVVKADAFSSIGTATAAAGEQVTLRRSSPYWREVTRFAGSGPATTPPFSVDRRALQWRARWRCERGAFTLQPLRLGGDASGRPLARAGACPERGDGLSVAQGDFRLRVEAQDRWQVAVEQQVDVPLVEPAPPALASPRARRVAEGRFYGIDEQGEGTVAVSRLPDGSAMVSLEDFYVTPNVDLELRLSTLERPRSTRQVVEAPFEDVRLLTATAGTMHFRVPRSALDAGVRSIVIWCEATRNAYAAASLRR